MWEDENKHKTIQKVAYYFFFALWYAISSLPMWVLYLISSFLSVFLYYVIRYRRDVVRKNIHDSFPDLSFRKRWLIERRFYTHFCDMFVESIKYFSMSEKEVRKRMQFKGVELLEESCRNGRSCGVYLGHYGNWEWISSMPVWMTPGLCLCTQFYRRLDNKVFNRLIEYTRSRWGGVNIPANESIRYLARYKREGQPVMIGFIADQVPWWRDIHYWTNFLNHPDTPVFTGAERIIKKFDMDVYYLDVRRIRRGRYVAEYKRISTAPNEMPEFAITEQYIRMFEHTIKRAPAYWLWTHKRWKRTKEEWQRDWAPKTKNVE